MDFDKLFVFNAGNYVYIRCNPSLFTFIIGSKGANLRFMVLTVSIAVSNGQYIRPTILLWQLNNCI